uniref:Protein kinase domain-containing protein n=1 Tax=Leersia perrieri TaxID=77586 RepID=A0A0D9UW36_9ORYZ
MENSTASRHSSMHTLHKALLVSSLLAGVAADAVGGQQNQQYCPPSSCGHLHNISYPFRLQGDSRDCVATLRPWYDLSCSSGKVAIQINTRTYYVTSIDYTDSSFLVFDPTMLDDTNNSCPIPYSDHLPYMEWGRWERPIDPYGFIDLAATFGNAWACFVNCSRAIADNTRPDNWPCYRPITCMPANNSFVFVSFGSCKVVELQPSCRYLAMYPFDTGFISSNSQLQNLQNASYTDTIGFIRKGFRVEFPINRRDWVRMSTTRCLNDSVRYFKEKLSRASIPNLIHALSWSEIHFMADCLSVDASTKKMFFVGTIVSAIDITKLHFEALFRFLLAPLVVLTFLAHKYWKTRITVDAVEKFLRMQQMIGPTRYAYTDIIAITSNFREKLGQGGYGSVYKGVLLPGNVHVAIKMLTSSSSCNGEEFISEVSTIGRIHHVNVVRLVGFCSEDMRRALIYEYMPHGSLDKYIFSSEKNFSWDKLNDIALGIARGINYLHDGCDMQILHFDIKPHNILLDDNFVPKVADFGLAKLYPRDKSFVPVSAARGTIGYIAPEMISRSFGVISSKSDVYSFGMLLLEMAGGRRNADPDAANSSQVYYPSRVYRQLTRQETCGNSDIVDMHNLEKKLCVVGLWCIQMRSSDRPTMSEVIEMLEGDSDDLQVPPKPFFCDDEQHPGVESYHLSSDLTAISEVQEDDDDDSICLFQSYHFDSFLGKGTTSASLMPDQKGRRSLRCSPSYEASMMKAMGGITRSPSFSCGHLKVVSDPFRRAADPPGCGSKSYGLVCSDTKATILIDNATYHVKEIDYYYSHFWVTDTIVDNSSCPLPRWNHLPDQYKCKVSGNIIEVEFVPDERYNHAIFVRCSQEVKNDAYRPVACASSNYSFVYVILSTRYYSTLHYIGRLEPSCGYLAMTPLGDHGSTTASPNASLSYADVLKYMRKGFAVQFPLLLTYHLDFKLCLAQSVSIFHKTDADIMIPRLTILFTYEPFWQCIMMAGVKYPHSVAYRFAIYMVPVGAACCINFPCLQILESKDHNGCS